MVNALESSLPARSYRRTLISLLSFRPPHQVTTPSTPAAASLLQQKFHTHKECSIAKTFSDNVQHQSLATQRFFASTFPTLVEQSEESAGVDVHLSSVFNGPHYWKITQPSFEYPQVGLWMPRCHSSHPSMSQMQGRSYKCPWIQPIAP